MPEESVYKCQLSKMLTLGLGCGSEVQCWIPSTQGGGEVLTVLVRSSKNIGFRALPCDLK